MTQSGGKQPGQAGEEAARALRTRAEAVISEREGAVPPELSSANAMRLIHEMQVHEVELELQQEELRLSRAEMEAERTRYLELYDFAPNGYVSLDSDGRLTRSNLAAARLLGGDRQGLTGRRLVEFLQPADRAAFRAFLEGRFRSGGQDACEVSLLAARQPSPVLLIQAECAAEGDECWASLVDITRRRQAEVTLRLRDRAIQAIAQGIVIAGTASPDLPILFANPAFERLTGYAAGEAVGRSFHFLEGPETDPDAVEGLTQALRDGRNWAVEILLYRKDGTSFWNGLWVTPIRNDEGVVEQYVAVLQDVTRRRAMEEALRKAQRMEAVGHLAGGIAHDFNTLLTIINGYSDLLEAGLQAEDPQREIVREIAGAGARAAKLTRQLLAYSRQQMLAPRVLDVNEVMSEVGIMLRGLLGESITVDIRSEGPTLLVKVDPAQLEQMWVNLAFNARDAMPEGGTLTLGASRAEIEEGHRSRRDYLVPGRYTLLTAGDTGHGMDEATQASIFDPFFTTRAAGTGTGMGLSMVYGFVKQSGGFITVDSEPGRGSTFNIYLPIPTEPTAGIVPTPAATLSPRGNETVLVVEDEVALLLLTRRILELHGYTVLGAGSGEQALELSATRQDPIDLLLTDVVMPRMGGGDLARRLRETRPDLQVVYMSGYTRDEVLRKEIDREEVHFLQKPFSPKALARMIRDTLNGREQAPDSEDDT